MTEKISSSSDPNIEHIIYDCEEVVPLSGNVYCKLVYIEKEGFEGKLIGVQACEENGTDIENGLIVVLEEGVFIRQPNLNKDRLSFMALDSKGRIKITT
jgi:hypothetical protein